MSLWATKTVNAVLAAARYNFRRLLAWLAVLWRAFVMALLAAATDQPAFGEAPA
jgi:hypothetical protein